MVEFSDHAGPTTNVSDRKKGVAVQTLSTQEQGGPGLRDRPSQAQLALEHTVKTFVKNFLTNVCDVCGGDKWRASFFCRKCCIRLQRIRLMSHRMNTCLGRNCGSWTVRLLETMAMEWDRCRDYLITSRKFPIVKATAEE